MLTSPLSALTLFLGHVVLMNPVTSSLTSVVGHVQDTNKSLSQLLTELTTRDLSDCLLVIVADEDFQDTIEMDDILSLPNPRQIIFNPSANISTVQWKTGICRAYLFLLRNSSTLFQMVDVPAVEWDFEGRYIIVGLTEDDVSAFISTTNGKKIEHVIGIIETENPIQYKIYMNLLYWGRGLTHINTWVLNRFTRSDPLFPDKISDLRGAELKVVHFELPPHIIYQRDSTGQLIHRYGRDVEIVRGLASVFNFSINFVVPPPGELWGDRLPNGSWDGIVQVLYSGQADIGVSNLYVSDLQDRMDFQHYSSPYAVERSCFTAKMEPPIPRWRSLILPYTVNTWVAFLIGLGVSCFVLYVLVLMTRASGGGEHPSLYSMAMSSLYTMGMHVRQSQHLVPHRDSTRSYLILLWFYAIVLTTSYSSNLTAFLTMSRQPKGMDTIPELRASGMPILCVNTFFYGSMVLSENKDIQALAQRYQVISTFNEVYELVLDGKGVNIESRSYLEYVVSTKFISPEGRPRMRIMKECISVSHIAMGFQIYSPLRSKFSKVISWMVEGGLVTNWFFGAIERAKKLQLQAKKAELKENEDADDGGNEGDDFIALSIDHLQSIFYLLVLGYLASFFVFLFEIIKKGS